MYSALGIRKLLTGILLPFCLLQPLLLHALRRLHAVLAHRLYRIHTALLPRIYRLHTVLTPALNILLLLLNICSLLTGTHRTPCDVYFCGEKGPQKIAFHSSL